jgi:putative ABC transport system permease protein
MLKNYAKIALRNLLRHKGYTFINVAGLAVGIACCLLILLYVQHEFSYDRFHEKADRIYRVTTDFTIGGNEMRVASTMTPLAPALRAEFPEVREAVRIGQFKNELLVSQGNQQFYEELFFFADSTLFDLFSFPLLHGDPATALATPRSVVLSEPMAQKYFGGENPIGKMLTVERGYELTVTGVLNDIPSASHLKPDFIATLLDAKEIIGTDLEDWGHISELYTYVSLSDAARPEALEAKLPALLDKYAGEVTSSLQPSSIFTLHLQPLTRVHLYSTEFGNNVEGGGDAKYLYVFISIALLILLIACINFMNLATARSMERVKEVGMRKVLGAHRTQLARQFLSESVLLALMALLVALALVELLLPVFNHLTERELATNYAHNPVLLLSLLGTILFVGAVAGSYPAFFLSGFRPVEVLRGRAKGGRAAIRLRQALVVLQFSISIALMISAGIMSAQMDFFREQDMGFDEEQVVVVPLRDPGVQDRYEAIKQAFSGVSGVRAVAASSSTPGKNTATIHSYRPEGAPDDQMIGLYEFFIDSDVLNTLGMELAEGRNFSASMPTDTAALLLNETAVKRFGWKDPVGKMLSRGDGPPSQVVGVVRDFNYISLDAEIPPLVMRIDPSRFSHLSVRLTPGETNTTLARLGQAWEKLAPGEPFDLTFIDQDYEYQYRTVNRLTYTIRTFTFLAILVACLGMFGLATFSVEQRTKEIGIRKVLGASVPGVVILLSKDFLKLVAVAFVVAAPAGYFVMRRWLEDFAYHIEVGPSIFAVAGGVTFALALGTVAYQAVKAALTDPVRSLKYE